MKIGLLVAVGDSQTFTVCHPTAWNLVLDRLCYRMLSSGSHKKLLETDYLLVLFNTLSTVEMLHNSAQYKSTIDIDRDTHSC